MTAGARPMWYSAAFANGTFVALAYDSTNSAYSTNGINWSMAAMPSATNWVSVVGRE